MIKENEKWLEIQKKIFPLGIPNSCTWTGINEISNILNLIGEYKNTNHMFYPTEGGMDLEGSELSNLKDLVGLYVGGSSVDLVKPKSLIFESFPDYNWNYFRLEILGQEPSGVYEKVGISEELVELMTNKYIDRSYWDSGEYGGEKLPNTARLITRYLKDCSFVIFSKYLVYNAINETYDARHNKMSAKEFREYINKGYNELKDEKNIYK